MPEYLKHRCCMCPNINKSSKTCPGIKGTPHPEPSECRFVKAYIDERGWIYHVRSGIGGEQFKGFYTKLSKDYDREMKSHAMIAMTWRDTLDKAQSDLNEYAKKKGWKVYESGSK